MNQLRVADVQRKLLAWYAKNKRDLPWRHTRDSYAIAVSEIMLQQTQVDRVVPKYLAWLQRWPNWAALSRATTREVLRQWSGLGYNRRGLMLRRLAQAVVAHGTLPKHRDELKKLPGIGDYTAGAIMSFAWRAQVSFIDTNIRRVLGRVHGGVCGLSEKKLQATAAASVTLQQPDLWHHALMDLGATICVARRPKCEACPLKNLCRSYPAILTTAVMPSTIPRQPFKGTDRYWRGRIVSELVKHRHMTLAGIQKVLRRYGKLSPPAMEKVMAGLIKNKMVAKKNRRYSV